jgi:predicted transcriptional regulator
MEKYLKRIIFYTTYCENQLNQYVPNSHIAITFCEVLEFVRYYNNSKLRELVFDDVDIKYKTLYNFENAFDEVFNSAIINDETVHQSYQTLCAKKNVMRNLLKLKMITHQEILMPLRVEYDMFDIFKKEFNNLSETNQKILKYLIQNNGLGQSLSDISFNIKTTNSVVKRACDKLVSLGAIDEQRISFNQSKDSVYYYSF